MVDYPKTLAWPAILIYFFLFRPEMSLVSVDLSWISREWNQQGGEGRLTQFEKTRSQHNCQM